MTIACSKFKLLHFYCEQPKWSVLLARTIVMSEGCFLIRQISPAWFFAFTYDQQYVRAALLWRRFLPHMYRGPPWCTTRRAVVPHLVCFPFIAPTKHTSTLKILKKERNNGHYQFCVNGFGLTNVPVNFLCMALLNVVLSPYLNECVFLFLDHWRHSGV